MRQDVIAEREHEFLELILDSLEPCIKIIDRTGLIIRTNLQCRHVLGAQHTRAATGQNYLQICDEIAARGEEYSACARRTAQELRMILAGTGRQFYHEYAAEKNGRQCWYATHISGFRDCEGRNFAAITTVDITTRVNAERRRQEANELMSAVIASTRNLTFVIEPDGRFLFPGGAPMLDGHPVKKKLDVSFVHSVAPKDRSRLLRAYYRTVRTSTPQQVECESDWFSGEKKILRATFAPLINGGTLPRVVCVADDITEYKTLGTRLTQAKKLATLGQMATSIAHEINQPMSVICLAAELIHEELDLAPHGEPDTNFIAVRVGRIRKMVMRVTRLIDQLRLFGRDVSSKFHMIDIKDALADALELADHLVAQKNIELQLNIERELPHIPGDTTQLSQVFMNLISNSVHAIESADRGGPRLIRISVRNDRENRKIQVIHEDTGPGFDETIREKLFEPFFTTKLGRKGTGLGLSISFGIIEAHEGSIQAGVSAEGGARFVIDFPIKAGLGRQAGANHDKDTISGR